MNFLKGLYDDMLAVVLLAWDESAFRAKKDKAGAVMEQEPSEQATEERYRRESNRREFNPAQLSWDLKYSLLL